jgi:hypothetical protein
VPFVPSTEASAPLSGICGAVPSSTPTSGVQPGQSCQAVPEQAIWVALHVDRGAAVDVEVQPAAGLSGGPVVASRVEWPPALSVLRRSSKAGAADVRGRLLRFVPQPALDLDANTPCRLVVRSPRFGGEWCQHAEAGCRSFSICHARVADNGRHPCSSATRSPSRYSGFHRAGAGRLSTRI